MKLNLLFTPSQFFSVRSFFILTWALFVALLFVSGCSSKKGEPKEEQIRAQSSLSDTSLLDTAQLNSIQGNLSLQQIPSAPNKVVLTGLPQHRLVAVYKSTVRNTGSTDGYYELRRNYYDDYGSSELVEHFMPGVDLMYGYNLLNLAHYDMKAEQLRYLFDHPVLVKSLYYPSFEQDSVDEKPINRDYYLVSVYDADTNTDTLINRKDLRRFYYFNASCSEKVQLIPPDYSVVRSQYDPQNDVMFIFARQDADHNGTADKKEPLHVFWFGLKTPAAAKRLY